MTITEFLLARIAEDEAEARRVVAMYPGSSIHAMGPVINKAEMALTIGGGRVLAECEVKRRIVAQHEAASSTHGGSTDAWYALGVVLSALASVYADHPDFGVAWRAE